MTAAEHRARAEYLFPILLAHREEAGFGLRKAKEWGISVNTLAGWFYRRRISTGHLFGTPEGIARTRRNRARKAKLAAKKKAAAGRCGATGLPCPQSRTCMYGGEALVERTGYGTSRFSKLETCARAIEEDVCSCRNCSRTKAKLPCDWRCWKTMDGFSEAREELVFADQRQMDRRCAFVALA